MWMILHLDDALYTEYDQLCGVKVSVTNASRHRVMQRRPIGALSAAGIVEPVATDRYEPVTTDFLVQVCRDHAPAIHARYLGDLVARHGLTGEFETVERKGVPSEIRCRLQTPRRTTFID